MRSLTALSLICFILGSCIQPSFSDEADIEENDFAEFEEFQDEAFENTPLNEPEEDLKSEFKETEESPEPIDDFDDEVTVEVDEGDEFEGDTARSKEEPKITFAKVPHHFRPNWDSYVLELLILAGLVVYFINFFLGRAKNQKIASMWFDANRTLLEENFSLVGDDGKLDLENPGLIKEAEHLYTLWCSGRSCCEGMLVELKLLKRQDLVSTIQQMMKPKQDQIQIKVKMNDDDMDTFVMCLAKKKSATKLVKDLADLATFCPEKKAVDKYNLPASYILMSEIGEASITLIDQRVVFLINKYPDLIDSIHVSDQYCGNKVPDDGAALTRLPVTEKVLILTINLSTGRELNESIEASHTVMALVFQSVEKLKRLRLSREAKSKAEKNRQKVEEAFLKNTHALRTEAAAAKREEKRRLEKERILAEEDPDRQRRWEEKEAKKDAKRRAPKMKQMKVRA